MFPAKLLQNDPPAWQKVRPCDPVSCLWLCYCAQWKQRELPSAILAQVPRRLERDGVFDLLGQSQAVHSSHPASRWTQPHRPAPHASTPSPRLASEAEGGHAWFPWHPEPKPRRWSNHHQTIKQWDAVCNWGAFSNSRNPFINAPVLDYGIKTSARLGDCPMVHRINKEAGAGAHPRLLRQKTLLPLSRPLPKHLGKVSHRLSNSFLFLKVIL